MAISPTGKLSFLTLGRRFMLEALLNIPKEILYYLFYSLEHSRVVAKEKEPTNLPLMCT